MEKLDNKFNVYHNKYNPNNYYINEYQPCQLYAYVQKYVFNDNYTT